MTGKLLQQEQTMEDFVEEESCEVVFGERGNKRALQRVLHFTFAAYKNACTTFPLLPIGTNLAIFVRSIGLSL